MKGNKLKVKTTFGDGASMKVALGLIEPPLPLPRSPVSAREPIPALILAIPPLVKESSLEQDI